DAGAFAQVRLDVLQGRAEAMRRHRDQHVASAVKGLPQVLGSLQFVGESGARQVALIAPRFPHQVDLRTVPSPQPGGMAFARELYGERRAPGTGADNR